MENDKQVSPKRSHRYTAKGLSFQVQTCQDKRSAKNKQAKRLMEDLQILMTANENSQSVASLLDVFIQCLQDANDAHEAFISLPLPHDELNTQNECFVNKMSIYNEFTERVKCWLYDVGHSYVSPNTHQSAKIIDDLRPEDSVSNISQVTSNVSKTHSRTSRVSSTASVRLQAEADKAALLERVAALNKKHEIEAEEERIYGAP